MTESEFDKQQAKIDNRIENIMILGMIILLALIPIHDCLVDDDNKIRQSKDTNYKY